MERFTDLMPKLKVEHLGWYSTEEQEVDNWPSKFADLRPPVYRVRENKITFLTFTLGRLKVYVNWFGKPTEVFKGYGKS